MKIVPVTKKLLPLAKNFVLPYEHFCVQLAAQIRKESQNLYILIKADNIDAPAKPNLTTNLTPIGILDVSSTLLHCIPDIQNLQNNADFTAALKNFFHHNADAKKIKCISGWAQTSDFLQKLLQEKSGVPKQINHYILMILNNTDAHDNSMRFRQAQPTNNSISNDIPQADFDRLNQPTLCNGDEILRCTQHHFDDLFPLQKQYYIQEVAPKDRKVTDAEVAITLRKILKNQLCLALYTDGQAASKVNTNAIGINWIQIGGVFTHPLYRRNGYATLLLTALCRRTAAAHKNSALFVKEKNTAAINLYQKLGFTQNGCYTIIYF